MKVHSVEFVFTKDTKRRRWTVGCVEDGTQRVLSIDEFNQWQQGLVKDGLQLVWSEDEMRMQMYGRFFDIPEDVLEQYKIEGFSA